MVTIGIIGAGIMGGCRLRTAREQARLDAPGASERAMAARLTAGRLPVTLAGGVATTPRADHAFWTVWDDGGAACLRGRKAFEVQATARAVFRS